jgi:hypothetical protein
MKKKDRIKSKRKVSQTRQMFSSRTTELQKALSIRKGIVRKTNNKKQKKNTRNVITMRQTKDNVAYNETSEKNNLWKILLKEKKSFRCRLFSQCVSRKS